MKIKRNEKCVCGSGKKFKHCCETSYSKSDGSTNYFKWAVVVCAAIVLSLGVWSVFEERDPIPEGHVWCPNCARYHAPDQK